jgi:hypothetical protein
MLMRKVAQLMRRVGLMVGAAMLAHSAFATEISIDSDDWLVASPVFTHVIEARSAVPLDVRCRPLRVHALEDGLFVLTTNPICHFDAVAPIWVVDPITMTVIVEGTGGLIRTTRMGHDRPLITFFGGRPGIGHEERWERREGRYSRQFYRDGIR